MKKLIQQADYLVSGGEIQKNVSIGIDGNQIVFVSDTVPAGFKADETIDAREMLALPGLSNTHTHLPMTVLRSYADGYDFHTWLFDKIMPVEDRLDDETVYWASLLGLAEMLRSGTTSFIDMYFFSRSICRAVSETKMRASITRPITASDQFSSVLEEEKALIADFHGAENGRITISVAPHAVYTNTEETLSACALLAKEHGLTVHTHISETVKENDDCIAQYGMTPTQLMQKAGLFESRVVAAHCVYLSDEDIEIFKESGATVAHNPTSNLKLGNGIAPIKKYREAGLNVSLGTDGTASNNNLNMLEEINLAGLLMCGSNYDPSCIQSADLLQMATENGAKAQGFSNLGRIEPGYLADLVLMKLDEPHLYPLHDVRNTLCYSAQAADVDTVIVDGNVLMRGRTLQTIDLEKTKAELSRCMKRLF